jgi:hypothetical protein
MNALFDRLLLWQNFPSCQCAADAAHRLMRLPPRMRKTGMAAVSRETAIPALDRRAGRLQKRKTSAAHPLQRKHRQRQRSDRQRCQHAHPLAEAAPVEP